MTHSVVGHTVWLAVTDIMSAQSLLIVRLYLWTRCSDNNLSLGEWNHVVCVCYRRKKKCIRYSVDDEDHVGKDTATEMEDEVLVAPANMTEASVMLSQPAAEDSDQQCPKDLPHHMLRHNVPVTLQTIPT